MKRTGPNLLLSTENLTLKPVYVGKHFLVTVAMYVLVESRSIKSFLSKLVLACPVNPWYEVSACRVHILVQNKTPTSLLGAF